MKAWPLASYSQFNDPGASWIRAVPDLDSTGSSAPRTGHVPDGRLPRGTICARSSTDRALDYGSRGWGFESLRARHGDRPIRPCSLGASLRYDSRIADDNRPDNTSAAVSSASSANRSGRRHRSDAPDGSSRTSAEPARATPRTGCFRHRRARLSSQHARQACGYRPVIPGLLTTPASQASERATRAPISTPTRARGGAPTWWSAPSMDGLSCEK